MSRSEPIIEGSARGFSTVRGTFYRAVEPAYYEFALAGSRAAGRFSPPDVPTLYLSSSPEGVVAAMIAHTDPHGPRREVHSYDVLATDIADLRDRAAMAGLGIDVETAALPWQDDVAGGRSPASWGVREKLERLGACGLIDPSRKRPGLWHLTLFAWNQTGAPSVH